MLVKESKFDHGYQGALQQIKHSNICKDANKKKNASFYIQGTHNLAGERKGVIWNNSKIIIEQYITEVTYEVKAISAVGLCSKGRLLLFGVISYGFTDKIDSFKSRKL